MREVKGGGMKVRPLHDRLLVRRTEEQEAAQGGILIPDSAQEKPQEGEVLALGHGQILDHGRTGHPGREPAGMSPQGGMY